MEMGEEKITLKDAGFYRDVVSRFFNRYINIMMLFFPLTSFLLVPSIQGTTITVVMAAILAMIFAFLPAGSFRFPIIKELFIFFCILLFLSIVSQFANLVYEVRLSDDLVLINKGKVLNSFYRASHLTQTLYLVVCFVIYLFVKYCSNEKVVNYIYWGLRLLCFYAIYEFLYFFLTGQNGDFIMNRKFGERDASLFQITHIAGLRLMRMKGYTGEPSMFAFSIIPFWVLTFALKRRFDSILLLVCLILTFSTTSYMAILLFTGFWFLYKRKYKQIIFVGFLFLVIMFILQLDAFRSVLDNLYNYVFGNKLSGDASSSKQRSGYFYEHIDYWSNLNGLSQLFGIGFGYVRSTDFLSTILVNNGIIGFLLFSAFTLKHLFIQIGRNAVNWSYKIGVFLLYFVMMATVPEFAYPSFWIYLALGTILQKKYEGTADKTIIKEGSPFAEATSPRWLKQPGFAVLLLLVLVIPGQAQHKNDDFVWGVNGHPLTQHNYRADTWADQLGFIKDMQLDAYRFDVLVDRDGEVRNAAAYSGFMDQLRAESIMPFPVLKPLGLKGLNVTQTYKASFNQGKNFALKFGKGISVVEVGNEEETRMILSGKMDGTKPAHYDLDKAALILAKLDGFIDGLKSVKPAIKVSLSLCWVHFYYLEMLENHDVNYDIIGYHWYSNMGDITKVRAPYGNILSRLHEKYGKPIWITEFNYHNGTLKADFATQNDYVVNSLRKILDQGIVEGFFFYELFDQPALRTSYPWEADYGLVYRKKGTDVYIKKDVYRGYKKVISDYKGMRPL